MPWFKVDDKLHDHRKARKARKAAMGVWVLAGSWCMDNLTDGFVPESVLPRWGNKHDARALVDAGLWSNATRSGEKGWQFHDWTRFQPSALVTQATRAKEQAAGVLGNHRRWHVERGITDPDCEHCHRVPDREPDWDPEAPPESGPESPPIPPVPVPHTEPKGSARAIGSATQDLVGEWIEHSSTRPPERVIGQVSRELKVLVESDQIPTEVVRRGLAAWSRKGLNASSLASFVHEQQKADPSAGVRVVNGSVDESSLPPVEDSWMRRPLTPRPNGAS